MRGRLSFAAAKSGAREESFGCDVDEAVDVVGKPRNWDCRSSYWSRSRFAVSCRFEASSLEKVNAEYQRSPGCTDMSL